MSAQTNQTKRNRPAWVSTALVTLASLVLAFVVAMIIMVVTDAEIMAKYAYFIARPSDALGASLGKISAIFTAMYVGSLGSVVAVTETTAQAAPLIAAGLGVALFKREKAGAKFIKTELFIFAFWLVLACFLALNFSWVSANLAQIFSA